jgi:hypothetical protein
MNTVIKEHKPMDKGKPPVGILGGKPKLKEILKTSPYCKSKDTLRLIVTYICNRSCPGCCNKNYPGYLTPEVKGFDYGTILITGGEPMLFPKQLFELTDVIRSMSDATLILYSAHSESILKHLDEVTMAFDGITLTLHEESDVRPYMRLNSELKQRDFLNMSLRLNIFKEANVDYNFTDTEIWKVKKGMVWLPPEECPVPDDEELLRLKHPWRKKTYVI